MKVGTNACAGRTALAFTVVLLAASAGAQELPRSIKGDPRQPELTYVRPDGLGVTEISLTAAQVEALRRGSSKTAFAYIAYTSISEPDLIGGIDAFDLLPLEFVGYYFALAVANFSALPHTGTVTMKLSGPTPWTERFNGVTVNGNTVTVLWWRAAPLQRVGNYLFKGTMSGAGSMKSRFCAGC